MSLGDIVEGVGSAIGDVAKDFGDFGKNLLGDITGSKGRDLIANQHARVIDSQKDLVATQEARDAAQRREHLRQSKRKRRIQKAFLLNKSATSGFTGSSFIGEQAGATTQFLASNALQSSENMFAEVLGEQSQAIATESAHLETVSANVNQRAAFAKGILNTFVNLST